MKLPASEIKLNPDNPRLIKDEKYKKLVQSLKDFPEMAEVREVVVNKEHMVLGGNMRFRAMLEAGWKEIPVKVVDWSEAKQREFVIKDNSNFGEWDLDIIANAYEVEELDAWGADLPYVGQINQLDKVNSTDKEWVGMPEYDRPDDIIKIIINFETEQDREDFLKKYPIELERKATKTWSCWHPYKPKDDVSSVAIQ